jgi:FMN phosphatase YigB (HAD superfamily)
MLKFIFLVGRTLIDEANFYAYIDSRLLFLLNQFGAKIDFRNYNAIKEDIIKNRKVIDGGIVELVIQICRVLMPEGYEKIILRYLLPSIEFAEKHFVYLRDDAIRTLEILCQYFKIGIIANQDKKILKILEFHDLGKNFHSCILSFGSNTEHDKEILGLVLEMMKKRATECIMIDDRLDRYMQHANILGMITIRLNSIFNLQEHLTQNEIPKFTLNNLMELVNIQSKMRLDQVK